MLISLYQVLSFKTTRCSGSCMFPDWDRADRCIIELPKGFKFQFQCRFCCKEVENCCILLLENDGRFELKSRGFSTCDKCVWARWWWERSFAFGGGRRGCKDDRVAVWQCVVLFFFFIKASLMIQSWDLSRLYHVTVAIFLVKISPNHSQACS